MNNTRCQYPICFTWGDQDNDSEININRTFQRVTGSSPIIEILADSEYKCVYDRDKNATAEIYISCNVLEKTFHLGVDLTNTVKDVKSHIKRLEKIPMALLQLFFNEMLLQDVDTLEESGLKNKSALNLGIKLHTARCENCKRSFIATRGKATRLTLDSISRDKYEVTLPLSSPVEYLKELIEEKYKVYPDNQLIMQDGRKLEDDVTLEEYGVTSESDLLLLLYQYENCSFCSSCAKAANKALITLKFFNNNIVCALNPKDTIQKLKETSYQFLHHIHPDLQQILFKNRELQDVKTLHECGIREGSKLYVKLRFDRRRCDECDGPLL